MKSMKYYQQGPREFYQVTEDETVLRIVNKELQSTVTVGYNRLLIEDATDGTKEITEQEFKNAYEIAVNRITSLKI